MVIVVFPLDKFPPPYIYIYPPTHDSDDNKCSASTLLNRKFFSPGLNKKKYSRGCYFLFYFFLIFVTYKFKFFQFIYCGISTLLSFYWQKHALNFIKTLGTFAPTCQLLIAVSHCNLLPAAYNPPFADVYSGFEQDSGYDVPEDSDADGDKVPNNYLTNNNSHTVVVRFQAEASELDVDGAGHR